MGSGFRGSISKVAQPARPHPWHITVGVTKPFTANPVNADALVLGVGPRDSGWGITFAMVGEVYLDPCQADAGTVEPAVADSAQGLVSTFTSLPGFGSTAEPAMVGGYPAYDPATCISPVLFTTPLHGSIAPRPGSNTHAFQLLVVDVDGTPLVIRLTDYPESSEFADNLRPEDPPYPHSDTEWATAQAKLPAILGSVQITPR